MTHMDAKKTTVRLTAEADAYLRQFCDARGLSFNAGLLRILKEHQAARPDDPAQLAAESVMRLFDERYGAALAKIQSAAGAADVNARILLEMVNTLLVGLRLNHLYYPTSLVKSDTMAEAEKEVQGRMSARGNVNIDQE